MKAVTIKQLLGDLLNKRGDAHEIVARLERSLILDDRLLEIFFAARACLLSNGTIDISIVHDWLRSNASSHDEALDLAEILYELRGYKVPTAGFDIDEEMRQCLHPSQIEAGKLICNPELRKEYYRVCSIKQRTGDASQLKTFQKKYSYELMHQTKSSNEG